MAFVLPPVIRNRDGETRKVGVELEYGGVRPDVVAEALIGLFGGHQVIETRFQRRIVGTRLGDFKLELDYAALRDARYHDALKAQGYGPGDLPIVEWLEAIAEHVCTLVAPWEVVSPPVPMTELEGLEQVRDALHRLDALGTGASFRYAFGLHFNVEAPALDAPTLTAYLKSFMVLYDWLVATAHVDATRRFFPFIAAFPDDYRRYVMRPEYAPDLKGLVGDYITANPTRNRPLDMVPLFTSLFGDEVRYAIKESDLVRPRPAFHYRLPNCNVDQAEWTLAGEWLRWLELEQLACDPHRLDALCAEYLALDVPARKLPGVWTEMVAARLARVRR